MIGKRDKGVEQEAPRHQASTIDVSALLAASQAVNSALGVEESLRVVLNSAKKLCEAHEGSVMLLDADGYLRILASEGIPEEIAREARVGPGEGVSGKVAQTGEPALISVTPTERQFESFVQPQRQLRSALSVPLKATGKTVGVLNLNLISGDRVFNQEDLRLAQIFGEQAAMAIQKASLLEEANRRSTDLALLLEAGKELMGLLDLETLLNRILDSATKITASPSGFVCIFEERNSRVTMAVFHGLDREHFRAALSHPGFSSIFSTDPIVPGVVSHIEAFEGLTSDPSKAVIGSIKGEGTTRAAVVVFGSGGQENSRLFHTFVSQAALAIRNAQLYEAVGRKEGELTSIVLSIPNPVVVVNESSELMAANTTAEELFGFSAEFLKGQPVKGLLKDVQLEELLMSPSDATIEVTVGNPMPRVWKARASRISAREAAFAGRILVMEDVTAERETEKLKADFVAVIGHELRTPLTLIKGFVKTLLRKGETMTETQRGEALGTVESQTSRLERLIEDLLYISRIETSRPPLHLETVDLSALARELMTELQAREPGRTFSLSAAASLSASMDKTKIEQVLYHLLDNAVKFSDPDKPVVVELRESPDSFLVSVTDKGIGILSGDIPTLFDRFHQVDLSSTRKAGGTGVGLYICKSLVEAHGGKIKVESVWGKGSTFTFDIPKSLTLQARPVAGSTVTSGS